MKKYTCTNCKEQTNGKKITSGSFLIEVLLWVVFFPVGILYSMYRLSSRKKVCGECKYPYLRETDSVSNITG